MKTRTVRQWTIIRASPHEVYEALMDSRRHSSFTGARASITRRVGGKFTAYDGFIEGVTLELQHDRRIVQSWRGSDWPPGHYSRTVFSLKEVKDGTRITLTQTGVPEEQYQAISQGWRDYYWKPLKSMLEGQTPRKRRRTAET